jgi:hypothetical protein
MPEKPFEIMKPALLVVEGKEDELFFKALITHLGLQIQVIPLGGKEKLRPNLKALASSPRFASEVISLGVVRDANSNPSAAFQSVRDALIATKLPAPASPLTPVGNGLHVIVMIVPEADTQGMLEDLCLKSVNKDPAMICVEHYFTCLQQHGLTLPTNASKARVQSYLAAKPEPGKRLGEAAEKGYWPWDEQVFDEVKKFLKQISTIES